MKINLDIAYMYIKLTNKWFTMYAICTKVLGFILGSLFSASKVLRIVFLGLVP